MSASKENAEGTAVCGGGAAGAAGEGESNKPRISLTVLFVEDAAGAGEGTEGSEELPKISAKRSVLLCTGAAGAPFGAGVEGISSPRRLSYIISGQIVYGQRRTTHVFARL